MRAPSTSQASSAWPQFLAAGLATLCAMCNGTVLGWTSTTLPELLRADHFSHDQQTTNGSRVSVLNDQEASWVGSLVPLGALVGALPAGLAADFLGRKRSILLLGLLYAVSWTIILVGPYQVLCLYAGRFVAGLASGAITVAIPMYNEEITEAHVRGRIGVFFDLMVNVGILWSYCLGALLPHPRLAIASGVVSIVFLASFVWMPESPVYLLMRGRIAEAESALRWLRTGSSSPSEVYDPQIELSRLRDVIDDATAIRTTSSLKELMQHRAVKIILGLMIFRPLSGINTITFYTVSIFQDSETSMPPSLATMIVGFILVISNVISSRLVDQVGRRILLLVSGVGITLCYVILVTYFYLKEHDAHMLRNLHWLPLFAVGIFVVSFCLGLGPLPWLLTAELLPIGIKSWASGIAVSLTWTLSFLITKFFSTMTERLGSTVTYGIFCTFCTFATVFILFAVPETKGKTREEIQKEMAGGKAALNPI